MTLTTKFDMGQKVWFMHNNRAIQAEIWKAMVHATTTSEIIEYSAKSEINGLHTLNETDVNSFFFLTKEELLKSL